VVPKDHTLHIAALSRASLPDVIEVSTFGKATRTEAGCQYGGGSSQSWVFIV